MALKVVKKVSPIKRDVSFNGNDLFNLAVEYDELRKQIKALTEKKDNLAAIIKDATEKLGVKDDKGSFYFDADDFITGKVAKTSISIDHAEGVKYLKSLGLKDLVTRQVVEKVNEDKLEQAVLDKKVSFKDVEKFTNKKVSYSVVVKSKEEMPEVELSTLFAAKRK